MPDKANSDQKSLAVELLHMSYGDLMSMASCISDIFINDDIDVSEPKDLAEAMHGWAKAVNESN